MINLYKAINYYIFYTVSKLYKKYEHHFKIGEAYYIGGSALAGMTTGLLILNIINIIGAFFQPTPIWLISKFFAYIPFVSGITAIVIFGYKNFHLVVYDQISKLEKSKRKALGIIASIYFITTFLIYFNIQSIVRIIYSITN